MDIGGLIAALPEARRRGPEQPLCGADACELVQPSVVSGSGGVSSGDRLSSLPDDVLLLVLVHLSADSAAARKSVLSRRWRQLWADTRELLCVIPTKPNTGAAPRIARRRPRLSSAPPPRHPPRRRPGGQGHLPPTR